MRLGRTGEELWGRACLLSVLGHPEGNWGDGWRQQRYTEAIKWAMGLEGGDVTPRLVPTGKETCSQ
jgi:hypothetical protein